MLKLATEHDFDFVYRLYMHPEINPYLLYETMDEASFSPIFQALISAQQIYLFSVDDHVVGMFKFIQQNHRTAHIAYLGGFAIAPEFAGQGYAGKMLQAAIELGRERGIKRLELSTSTDNLRAIHVYQRAQFQAEGVLRRYTYLASENRYLDEVMMSYLYE